MIDSEKERQPHRRPALQRAICDATALREVLRKMVRSSALWLVTLPLLGVGAGDDGSQLRFVAQASSQRPTQSLEEVQALFREGRYTEAEARARPLLAAAEAASGPRSLEAADALDLLVRVLERVGKRNQPEVLALAERAVEIREALLGPADPRLAASLHSLGFLHFVNWRLDKAQALFERSLAMRVQTLGSEHPDVAESLQSMGLLHDGLGRKDEARAFLERALGIRERTLGPDHLDVAESLNSLASLLYGVGDHKAAKRLYTRALEIRERALGGGHPVVAASLHNLGIIDQAQGDYAGARRFYERAMKIRLSALPADHPATLSTHQALATLLQITGDYTGARAHYERALEGQRKRLGEDHPEYAQTLCSLALLLHDSGDFGEAEELHRRALDIRRRVLGPSHPDVAFSLTWLGHLLQRQGQSAKARPLFEQALAIQEQTLGRDHHDVADTLIGLAGALEAAGDLPGARRLLERSLAIYENTYAPADPILITPLTELAELLELTGDLASARHFYQRALLAAGKFPGVEFHRTANILSGEARILARLGRWSESLEIALRGESLATEHVSLTARALPERQALAYSASMNDNLDLVLSVVSAAPETSPRDRRKVWDAVIRSRALVLDEMAARQRTLSSARSPQTERLWGELCAARQVLANLVVRGPVGLPSDQYATLVADARRRRERAERALAGTGLESLVERVAPGADMNAVSAALPTGSALVGYVLFNRLDLSPAPSAIANSGTGPVAAYLALVLRAGRRDPAMVLLGSAAELDRYVQDWRREASGGAIDGHGSATAAETACRGAGETLRKKIWDPVAGTFQGVERVFVIPDGSLNLVNLAALPVDSGGYLVETGPEIHLLSAERDLVARENKRLGDGLLALGGADFDDSSSFVRSSGPLPTPRTRCDDLQSVSFSPLPATAVEIDELISLWSATTGSSSSLVEGAARSGGSAGKAVGSVLRLSEREANESAFKTLAPGRRVLHLATHGFFFNGRCPASTWSARGIGGVGIAESEAASPLPGENPLLLSGLALAGANDRAAASPGDDDGILTAEEIASLDLAGVEWAVLSGCDTGIGEIRAGEGVLGLRRAFQIAGARTVVMSLWSVEDRAARVWMKALYEGRLVQGRDTARAVHNASLTALQVRAARGESTHPFFWAGFVASGDWR